MKNKNNMPNFFRLFAKTSAIIFAAAILLLSSISFATAENLSISVEPAKISINGKPGEKVKKSLQVVNRGNYPAHLKVYVKDFKIIDSKGSVELYDESKDSAANWLIPEFYGITIPPLEAKTVSFITNITNEMAAGGHSGAIMFEPSGNNDPQKKFGVQIFLNVIKEGATTGGKIVSFSSLKFQFSDPAKIGLSVKNLGNSHFVSSGSIVLTNWQGKKVAQSNIGELSVSPGQLRAFEFNWNNDKPLLGFYKAEINLTNSMRPDDKLGKTTWFLFVPIKFILLSLFGIILAVAGALVFKNRKNIAKKWLAVDSALPFS